APGKIDRDRDGRSLVVLFNLTHVKDQIGTVRIESQLNATTGGSIDQRVLDDTDNLSFTSLHRVNAEGQNGKAETVQHPTTLILGDFASQRFIERLKSLCSTGVEIPKHAGRGSVVADCKRGKFGVKRIEQAPWT